MNHLFTKRKFLTFPLEQQHKKCADVMRKISDTSNEELSAHYNEIQQWMNRSPLTFFNPESISERYHEHLRLSGQKINEGGYLTFVRTGDKEQPIEEPWPITIYLDQIRSAHNVGSILRTVEAFSLGRVCFSKNTPYINHNQVQKTSMRTFEHVECSKIENISDLPRPLIVMETSALSIPLHDFTFPEKFTLAVGNEEYGCSEELLKQADTLIEIPLRGRKNSLNVANAFAIAAAEIANQR